MLGAVLLMRLFFSFGCNLHVLIMKHPDNFRKICQNLSTATNPQKLSSNTGEPLKRYYVKQNYELVSEEITDGCQELQWKRKPPSRSDKDN